MLFFVQKENCFLRPVIVLCAVSLLFFLPAVTSGAFVQFFFFSLFIVPFSLFSFFLFGGFPFFFFSLVLPECFCVRICLVVQKAAFLCCSNAGHCFFLRGGTEKKKKKTERKTLLLRKSTRKKKKKLKRQKTTNRKEGTLSFKGKIHRNTAPHRRGRKRIIIIKRTLSIDRCNIQKKKKKKHGGYRNNVKCEEGVIWRKKKKNRQLWLFFLSF